MARYWVVGGEYTDTHFREIAGGGAERRIGPFDGHAEAQAEWSRRSWASVDDAHARWRIEEDVPADARARWWVVGGVYLDSGFTEPEGGAEQWHGPFDSYEAAKAAWGRLAWSTVDDALARFRIEKLAGDRPPER